MRSYKWIFKNADRQLHEEDMITMRSLSFHGVAMGIQEHLMEKTVEIEAQHRNLIAVKIEVGAGHILVINVYMPTSGKDEIELQDGRNKYNKYSQSWCFRKTEHVTAETNDKSNSDDSSNHLSRYF